MDFSNLFSGLGTQPAPPPAETESAYGFGGYGIWIIIIIIAIFFFSRFWYGGYGLGTPPGYGGYGFGTPLGYGGYLGLGGYPFGINWFWIILILIVAFLFFWRR